MKTAIVTVADHQYAGLLADMLDSLERVRREMGGGGGGGGGGVEALAEIAALDVCVLDVGLFPAQREQIAPRVARIVSPGWDLEFPQREICKQWFQAMVARPHLPRHFPQYDRYIWLDSDVWMQDARALEMLLMVSRSPTLAIVPEIHRSYIGMYTRQMPSIEKLTSQYVEFFGETAGRRYAGLPILNGGVFAAQRDLPMWQIWSKRMHAALQISRAPTVEQCTLNACIFDGAIPFYPLPAWCNWMCSQAIPLLDVSAKTLHEPGMPHERLSIVHLSDWKFATPKVNCSDGQVRSMPLTYSSVRRGEWGGEDNR